MIFFYIATAVEVAILVFGTYWLQQARKCLNDAKDLREQERKALKEIQMVSDAWMKIHPN